MPADPARLYQQLLNTGLQNKDNPLYQLLRGLIDATLAQSRTSSSGSSSGGGGPNVTNETFLTETDETSLLPNSRQLLAGDAIAFDDTTPNERTVDVLVDGVTIGINGSNELEALGGGASLTRQSATFQTGNVGSGATASGSFTLTGSWESVELLKIEIDEACYMVLYSSPDARTGDTRTLPATTDPIAGTGVLMDLAFGTGGGSINVSPPVVVYNSEAPVTTSFYYRLYNAGPSVYDFEVTLTYIGFQ